MRQIDRVGRFRLQDRQIEGGGLGQGIEGGGLGFGWMDRGCMDRWVGFCGWVGVSFGGGFIDQVLGFVGFVVCVVVGGVVGFVVYEWCVEFVGYLVEQQQEVGVV